MVAFKEREEMYLKGQRKKMDSLTMPYFVKLTSDYISVHQN